MKIEKSIRILILFISIIGLIYFASGMDFGMSDRYANLILESSEFERIIDERTQEAPSSNPDIFFDDFALSHDALTDTYLYSVIDESPSRFNPLVRTQSSHFNRYDVAIREDILNEESIRNNETTDLILYTDDTYKIYSLAATTLPVVSVSMNTRADDRDNPISGIEEPASFTLFDNRSDVLPSERIVNSQTYIRLRGATSRRFDKNQFRVKLREFSIGGSESNNNVSLLGMREDDDWILYSPFNDPEKMRNTLSNNLWYETFADNNPLGVTNGTQGTYVELFIDGKYWGIYTLMHPIDRKQLQLSVNNSNTSDFYYRAMYNDPFEIEDFTEPGEQYIRGRFELRNPEPNGSPRQWDPLVRHISVLDEDEEAIINYVDNHADIDNLIDYYLFYVLIQATDNNTKNRNYIAYYIDGDHFMLESPWDLDLTWGLRWTPEHPRLSVVRGEPHENFSPSVSHVTRLIDMDNSEVKQQVSERYNELRHDQWSDEAFMQRIDLYESMLYGSGAMTRNYSRWPSAAYAESTESFRSFIIERLHSMDNYLDNKLGGD